MAYLIKYAYICHTGKIRVNNEDNFWCCGEKLSVCNDGSDGIHTGRQLGGDLPVFGVFDGMGGESQGEMASYLASSTFDDFYQSHRKDLRRQPEEFLLQASLAMNNAVCRYSREKKINAMGTTMAMIAFENRSVHICNLGDSRIYEVSQGKLKQISRDHVLAGYMLGKSPLTQFLGIEEEDMKIEPAVKSFPYEDGKRYLLCSDGVTDMLSDPELEKILTQGLSVEETARRLMDQVLERGARDNTTIILCETEQKMHPLRRWIWRSRKENEGEIL